MTGVRAPQMVDPDIASSVVPNRTLAHMSSSFWGGLSYPDTRLTPHTAASWPDRLPASGAPSLVKVSQNATWASPHPAAPDPEAAIVLVVLLGATDVGTVVGKGGNE